MWWVDRRFNIASRPRIARQIHNRPATQLTEAWGLDTTLTVKSPAFMFFGAKMQIDTRYSQSLTWTHSFQQSLTNTHYEYQYTHDRTTGLHQRLPAIRRPRRILGLSGQSLWHVRLLSCSLIDAESYMVRLWLFVMATDIR
jgi:hypothetical protein